jgi:hypothetical protein
MPSWSDIIGGPVSFSQKVTDAWSGIIGGSDSTEEEEPEPEPEPEPEEEKESTGGSVPKWPPNPCVEPSWSDDASKRIEVNIFWSWHRKDVAEKLADHARYALGEAFGQTHEPVVNVVDKPVPQNIRDLNDFIPYYEKNGPIAADCNILVTETGDASGGGSSAICGRISDGDPLVGECIRERGSGPEDELVNEFLHEIGHCLGFDHNTSLRISEYGGSYKPPMPGSYVGEGNRIHRYHPDSLKNAESAAFEE